MEGYGSQSDQWKHAAHRRCARRRNHYLAYCQPPSHQRISAGNDFTKMQAQSAHQLLLQSAYPLGTNWKLAPSNGDSLPRWAWEILGTRSLEGGIFVMCASCHVESHATGLHMTWVMHCQQGACRCLRTSAPPVDCKSICILLNKCGVDAWPLMCI